MEALHAVEAVEVKFSEYSFFHVVFCFFFLSIVHMYKEGNPPGGILMINESLFLFPPLSFLLRFPPTKFHKN